MALLDFFKEIPKWKNSDPKIREAAVICPKINFLVKIKGNGL